MKQQLTRKQAWRRIASHFAKRRNTELNCLGLCHAVITLWFDDVISSKTWRRMKQDMETYKRLHLSHLTIFIYWWPLEKPYRKHRAKAAKVMANY